LIVVLETGRKEKKTPRSGELGFPFTNTNAQDKRVQRLFFFPSSAAQNSLCKGVPQGRIDTAKVFVGEPSRVVPDTGFVRWIPLHGAGRRKIRKLADSNGGANDRMILEGSSKMKDVGRCVLDA
jgi:hypothetical protein